MATEAIVSFAIERLGDLLIEEAKFLHGISNQVRGLRDELQRMRSFLEDADIRQHESERIRNWIEQIREAAYDAEDVLETYVLEVDSKHREGALWNAFQRFSCILNRPVILHRIGSEIENIRTRLSDIAASMQNYGIQEALIEEGSNSWQRKREKERETFPEVFEQNLVGVEKVVEELVSDLMEEKKNFRVALICGMGGIGKTTLAKEIFHHPKVRKHFDHFAWVFISQEFERREIWKIILSRLYPASDANRIMSLPDQELVSELLQFMRSNKCLVVLDDIWSPDAWDQLKDAVPRETHSRVLLTSRSKDIASHTDPDGLVHETQCLNEDESWDLFQKIALAWRNNDTGSEDKSVLEELGKQMVKYCAGLPLAIKVLGGLLATRLNYDQWQKVHENIKIYITRSFGYKQRDTKVYNVLSLSYDDLPSLLKRCFLYLALFPEDYEISVDKLKKFWASEGLVASAQEEGLTAEEVAEYLLHELIERSMVFVGRRDVATSKILTCRMHDLMRDICSLKAKEESFAWVINPTAAHDDDEVESYGKFYRLSVPLYQIEGKRFFRQKSLGSRKRRSLLYFNTNVDSIRINPLTWTLLEPGFEDLGSLRVLDLEGAILTDWKLLKDIGGLIHLRFLSFKGGRVSVFPSSLRKLRLLETLDLRVLVDAYIPNVIWKMRKLRHLYLPLRVNLKSKLRLDTLKDLQTLENFQLGICDVRDLFRLTSLKRLTLYRSWKARGVAEIMPPSLCDALRHLRSLYLGGEENFVPPAVDVRALISGYANLSSLVLSLKIVELPASVRFPRDITFIELAQCELKEDPMPVLEKLPNVKDLRVISNAYVSKRMVCSKYGFPRLCSLLFSFLCGLEEWRLEEGAMPNLSTLYIADCRRLRMVPDAVKGIRHLKEVEISRMPKAFKDKLVPGGEDFYKVQHIPSVVFDLCHRDDDDDGDDDDDDDEP